MFKPKTAKIEDLAKNHQETIKELETIFANKANVYIDYTNVLGWENKLGWKVDIRRLKQFLDSFATINSVNFYYGTLKDDIRSEDFIKDVQGHDYNLKTKPVKIMHHSIDVSSI